MTSCFLHVFFKVNLSHTWHYLWFKKISKRRTPVLCREVGVVKWVSYAVNETEKASE